MRVTLFKEGISAKESNSTSITPLQTSRLLIKENPFASQILSKLTITCLGYD